MHENYKSIYEQVIHICIVHMENKGVLCCVFVSNRKRNKGVTFGLKSGVETAKKKKEKGFGLV